MKNNRPLKRDVVGLRRLLVNSKSISMLALGFITLYCSAPAWSLEPDNNFFGENGNSHNDWTQESLNDALSRITEKDVARDVTFNYFLRRSDKNLPTEEGIILLKSAIKAEPTGSERWTTLQSILGLVAFNSSSVAVEDGFNAYKAIFDQTIEVKTGSIRSIQAQVEYVAFVQTRFKSLNLQSDVRTKETLIKAWQAYIHTDRSSLKLPLPEPDFAGAFVAIGAQKESEDLVLRALSDPAIPRSFALLTGGAAVMRESQPQQAVKWLIEARAFLPQKPTRKDGKVSLSLDVNETAKLYDQLVSLLETLENWPDAITYQRERIGKTGGGYGKLWLLLRKTEDEVGQANLIIELQSSHMSAREILRAANVLTEPPTHKNLNGSTAKPKSEQEGTFAAIKILQTLLLPPRTLEINEQIEARTLLALNLWRVGQLDAALSASKMSEPQSLPNSGRTLWNGLLRLQTAITTYMDQVKVDKLGSQPPIEVKQ